jgi:hypothetical protein
MHRSLNAGHQETLLRLPEQVLEVDARGLPVEVIVLGRTSFRVFSLHPANGGKIQMDGKEIVVEDGERRVTIFPRPY